MRIGLINQLHGRPGGKTPPPTWDSVAERAVTAEAVGFDSFVFEDARLYRGEDATSGVWGVGLDRSCPGSDDERHSHGAIRDELSIPFPCDDGENRHHTRRDIWRPVRLRDRRRLGELGFEEIRVDIWPKTAAAIEAMEPVVDAVHRG